MQYAIDYNLDDYDKHGFLKPSLWLWLAWLFLAKAWIVFIVASVSRTMGSTLLEIVYPVSDSLYLGLIAGLPIVFLAWTISLRTPERKRLNVTLSYGRGVTCFVALAQLSLTFYHLFMTRWQFNWSDALTLQGLVWLLLFLMQSTRVRDTFITPNLR